jgi:hypothetical protein
MGHSLKIIEMCLMVILKLWQPAKSILSLHLLVGYRKWGHFKQEASLLARMLTRILTSSIITTSLRWNWETKLIITLLSKVQHQKPIITIALKGKKEEIQT